MKIPLYDLQAQYESIKQPIDEAIDAVIDRCDFILGEEVSLFEQEIAAYLGVKHAIGVSSGTDAIAIALRSAGLKRGDKVITVPNSFVATAEAIVMVCPEFICCDC